MNDRIDIKDKKTLIRLLRSCYFVYAYIVLGGGNASGFSIKLQI